MRLPDVLHPITIEPSPGRVVVRLGATVVADTGDALVLREASYRPVHYVPLADVDPSVLRPSEHSTYCPFKGHASYYSLEAEGRLVPDALWTYQEPYDAVAQIRGHVAFYPQNVTFDDH